MTTSALVWRRGARELLAALLDLALPPHCAACGSTWEAWPQPLPGLCGPCAANLVRRSASGCPRCGESIELVSVDRVSVDRVSADPVSVDPGSIDRVTPPTPSTDSRGSGRCRGDHRMLRGLTFAVAPFAYAGSGGALVRRFKLDGEFAAGAWLCRAMARHLAPRLLGPWRNAVLVPVPLHARRRRERGFDQALHLAHALARRFGLAVAGRGLVRKLATLPQGDPRVLSRDGNVAGAFAVPRPSVVAARRIVLVDDVLTSGATARTCAAALLRAGASAVGLVTACRS